MSIETGAWAPRNLEEEAADDRMNPLFDALEGMMGALRDHLSLSEERQSEAEGLLQGGYLSALEEAGLKGALFPLDAAEIERLIGAYGKILTNEMPIAVGLLDAASLEAGVAAAAAVLKNELLSREEEATVVPPNMFTR